jgi:hypothetical protein
MFSGLLPNIGCPSCTAAIDGLGHNQTWQAAGSQTFYLLRTEQIKAAKKVGDRHCADVAGLRAQFCSRDAAN